MIEKIFTREEADHLLPQVEQILSGLIENRNSAMEVSRQLTQLQEQMRAENGMRVEAADLVNRQTELEFLLRIINEGLDAIEALGAQPKDLELGLVDFPSIINGKEVLLCWKLGEKSIGFYHDLFDGYSSRKPLPEKKER